MKKSLLLMLAVFTLCGCIKEELPNIEVDIEEVIYDAAQGIIDVKIAGSQIDIYLADAVDATHLALNFVLSEDASIEPNPVDITDYSVPQHFTVTSEDGVWSKTYTVKVVNSDFPQHFDFEHWRQESYYFQPYELQGDVEANIWACGNSAYSFAVTNKDWRAFPTQPTFDAFIDEGESVEDITASGMKPRAALLITKPTPDAKIPIAAGNLFIGTFNASHENTLECTYFGLPFRHKLLSVSGYYKYKSAGATLKTGIDDECKMQAVVYLATDEVPHLDGTNVKTSPNIVGRGEWPSGASTEGDGYYPFHFDINYTASIDPQLLKEGAYKMSIIFSSSRNGDQFDGAVGSELYIDNVALTIEK